MGLNNGILDQASVVLSKQDDLFYLDTDNDGYQLLPLNNMPRFEIGIIFSGFVDFYKERQTSMIMMHHEPSIPALQRTGVVAFDADYRVLELQEKPQEPKTHYAVPPFYIYKKEDIPLIKQSIEEGCNTDAPGSLAGYLIRKTSFHVWEMPGKRHDIGTLETYNQLK
ncbi:hypothetical protein LJB91_00735 [Bacteroidales bacterium OttesenSCG-928-L03]|nr:hypothetical protein [Bacteroidales bacterium OttesenSCG-928-L03]